MRGRALRLSSLLALVCAVTLAAQDSGAPAIVQAPTIVADTLFSQGMFDEADAIYATELTRNPGSARARFGVARTLAMRSQLADALREVSTAVAAAPGDGEIVALEGDIYERLYRYEEAAKAFEAAIALASPEARVNAGPIMSRVALLRSFGTHEPAKIERDPDATYKVPFSLVNKKIVMRGRVNGAAVSLVLDTGSERSTVTEQTATRAGVKIIGRTLAAGVGFPGVTRLSIGSADRIELGKMRIRNVPISIRPLPRFAGVPDWQNEIFSPVPLGLSTIIDYAHKQVIFGRHLPEEAADIRLPLRIYRLPFVRGVLNTRVAAYFVVDTGGELISISADTATDLNMTPVRHIPLRVFGMSGLDEQAFLLPGVDVAFQDLQYRNFGIAVLNLRAPSTLLGFRVGGIVGHKLLAGYRVAMDIERSELRLTKLVSR